MIGTETEPTTRALEPRNIRVPSAVIGAAFGVTVKPAIEIPLLRGSASWPLTVVGLLGFWLPIAIA